MRLATDRQGFTLIETLFVGALTVILLAVAVQLFIGARVQEKQVSGYSGLQREARKAIEQVQRDLRSMATLDRLVKDSRDQVQELLLGLPEGADQGPQVSYIWNENNRRLSRNGVTLLEQALVSFQLWPYDGSEDPKELTAPEQYKELAFMKVRITLAPEALEGEVRGERDFDFIVYPRLPASRLKARLGRLNLEGGRFAPVRRR